MQRDSVYKQKEAVTRRGARACSVMCMGLDCSDLAAWEAKTLCGITGSLASAGCAVKILYGGNEYAGNVGLENRKVSY